MRHVEAKKIYFCNEKKTILMSRWDKKLVYGGIEVEF